MKKILAMFIILGAVSFGEEVKQEEKQEKVQVQDILIAKEKAPTKVRLSDIMMRREIADISGYDLGISGTNATIGAVETVIATPYK